MRVPHSRFIPACAGNRAREGVSSKTVSVHPRVCGEQVPGDPLVFSKDGSSPRVRGTVPLIRQMILSSRFFPACAGNRLILATFSAEPAVHPRVCGEQVVPIATAIFDNGSSPRVRGTVRYGLSPPVGPRFIPACAGNSPKQQRRSASLPVHPRVCGEQPRSERITPVGYGSSPRVRGTATKITIKINSSRFIPACAGNSIHLHLHPAPSSVHPRVCGEQHAGRNTRANDDGSSPRVRGTVNEERIPVFFVRFIPACAGNRRHRTICDRLRPVHPRVCGEQLLFDYNSLFVVGSSPRVRGTDHLHRFIVPRGRFIPACAGNSITPIATTPLPPVHPRVCGEQARKSVKGNRTYGSSPRVRGTDIDIGGNGFGIRFIPACAGNRWLPRQVTPNTSVHPRVCGEQPPARWPGYWGIGSSPRVRGTATTHSAV